MEQTPWRNVCCNPFNKPGHQSMKKNLRPVLPWMIEVNSSVKAESKICDSCRKELIPITIMSKPPNIPSVSMHEELLDELCDKP